MDIFFKSLETIKCENVFNPWFANDIDNDIDSGAPGRRLLQLRQYLSERKKAKYILMAEALGYQGGHFSGIPMTSERILLGKMTHKAITPQHVFSGIKPGRTSKPSIKINGFTEPTATIVWERLIKSGFNMKDFIFWNAFPWHPYRPEKGILSNRTPSDEESVKGQVVIKKLLYVTNSSKIIVGGEKAKIQLVNQGITASAVRHPANGGAGKIREPFTSETRNQD